MATLTLRLDRAEQHDLQRRVQNFLHKQTNPDVRTLTVKVSGDVVNIHGQVTSQYARDLATICCQRVAGVRRVVNEAVVDESHESLLAT